MFLLFILLPGIIPINLVDNYIDQNIYIVYSNNDNLVLGHKMNLFDNNPFIIVNLNHQEDAYKNKLCRLTKHKKHYSLKIGSDDVCGYEDELRRCDDFVDMFTIKEHKYGFIIKKEGKCLTYDDGLSMKKCGKNNQSFLFKKLNISEICEAEKPEFITSRRKIANGALQNMEAGTPITEPDHQTQKKRDKKTNEILSKYIKDTEKKPKVKKVLKKLYEAENGWKFPSISLWYLKKLFCP